MAGGSVGKTQGQAAENPMEMTNCRLDSNTLHFRTGVQEEEPNVPRNSREPNNSARTMDAQFRVDKQRLAAHKSKMLVN